MIPGSTRPSSWGSRSRRSWINPSASTSDSALEPIAGDAPGPVRLAPGETLTVGRSLSCQYTLPDESVSRRHASLVHERGRWLLTDMGSRHGTFVNAIRLRAGQPAVLGPGDLVRLGPYTFSVEVGVTSEPTSWC